MVAFCSRSAGTVAGFSKCLAPERSAHICWAGREGCLRSRGTRVRPSSPRWLDCFSQITALLLRPRQEMTTSHTVALGSERLYAASCQSHFLVSKNTSHCHRKGDYRAEDRQSGGSAVSLSVKSSLGFSSIEPHAYRNTLYALLRHRGLTLCP